MQVYDINTVDTYHHPCQLHCIDTHGVYTACVRRRLHVDVQQLLRQGKMPHAQQLVHEVRCAVAIVVYQTVDRLVNRLPVTAPSLQTEDNVRKKKIIN